MEINTVRNWTAREVVATTDLKAGEIIIEHGGLFALTNRREYDGLPDAGPTICFDGVYLGPAFTDDDCAIPAHWRVNEARAEDGSNHGYWLVQGNRYAMRCRLTDPRPMFYRGTDSEHLGHWAHEPAPDVEPSWVAEYEAREALTPAEQTALETYRKLSA